MWAENRYTLFLIPLEREPYRLTAPFAGGLTGTGGSFTGFSTMFSAAVLMSSIRLLTRAALLPRSCSK